MNPTELARKLEAILVDYDYETAMTALKITELLLDHREGARFAYESARLAEGSEPSA